MAVGVAVGVRVGVAVGVRVGVAVGVRVAVAVAVAVGLAVAVAVGSGGISSGTAGTALSVDGPAMPSVVTKKRKPTSRKETGTKRF